MRIEHTQMDASLFPYSLSSEAVKLEFLCGARIYDA